MNQKDFSNILNKEIILLILFVTIVFSFFILKTYFDNKTTDRGEKQYVEEGKSKDYSKEDLPRFEDFLVESFFEGPSVNVNFESHENAKKFKTAIANGVRDGLNFAGKYVLISWGCGTMCQTIAIVDADNGNIYFAPFSSSLGVEFKKDSSLLVVNPPNKIKETFGDDVPDWAHTYYYNWNKQEFIEVPFIEQNQGNSNINNNWNTYQDKNHVFEFKYPANWFIKERYSIDPAELRGSNTLLKELMIDDKDSSGTDSQIINIRVYDNPSLFDLSWWLKSKKNNLEKERGCGVLDIETTETRAITIDGINGLRESAACCCGYSIDSFFVQKGDKVYSIGILGSLLFTGEEEMKEFYENILNNIVSSFRFLKVEWSEQERKRIFISDTLGISFEYSSDFIIMDRLDNEEKAILIGPAGKEFPRPEIAPWYRAPISISGYKDIPTSGLFNIKISNIIVNNELANVIEGNYQDYPAPGIPANNNEKIISIPSKNLTIIAQSSYANIKSNWDDILLELKNILESIRFN